MDFNTVVLFIKQVCASLLILLTMSSSAAVGEGREYTAESPEELIASFAVVSDIHVETNYPESYQNLSDLLYGIKAGENIDAVIYTGDNVMNGQVAEDFLFYSAVRSVMPAEHNIILAGNHDLGNSEGDYSSLRDKFIFNQAFYLGTFIKNDYYYRVVNGCYLIMLTSEDTTTWEFRMSEEQFTWLENVLKKAEDADASVIVFNHYPLRYLKDNDPSRLANLLAQYDTELFIHGHIHNEMGRDNFYKSYGIDCINLPRATETTEYEAGDGIVIEVYEDSIIVKARDFISGEWIDGLRYEY